MIRRDEHGLIIQADGDGGDTAQREGMVAFASFTTNSYLRLRNITKKLEVEPGVFVRHPFQGEWINKEGTLETFRADPKHFSRDQHDPLIMAWGFFGLLGPLKRTFAAQLSRYGRYQNKDWTNLNSVSVFVRAFEARKLWLLLCLTDFGLLGSSIGKLFKGRDPNYSDDNNHIMRLIQAQRIMSTPVSWLARKIYKWFRPKTHHKHESSGPMSALTYYHSEQFGGNPDIAEMYRPLVEAM